MQSTWDVIITEERDKVNALLDREWFLSMCSLEVVHTLLMIIQHSDVTSRV